MPLHQRIGLIAGPLLFFILFSIPVIQPFTALQQQVIAVGAWMLVWWLTEAVALPVAALLPLVLFPVFGIADINKASAPYGSPIIFLFMGGFVIALALEKWKLHLRIALTIVRWTGGSANGIIFGFMLATALISMWISNTATTVMMLPIALSVVTLVGETLVNDAGGERIRRFALSLLLGVAYAASIGGMGTIIGTPPNSVFAAYMLNVQNEQVTFAEWFIVGFPFAALLLVATYLILVNWIFPNNIGKFEGIRTLLDIEMEKLGPMKREEKRVMAVFGFTALLWMVGPYITNVLPWLKINDTSVSVLGAVAMFVTPSRRLGSDALLNWTDTHKLPWGILLLFGGGLSMADAMADSGIVTMIGNQVSSLGLSPWLVVVLTVAIVIFLTEVMSNVALITIFLPVIGGISAGLGIPVLWLALPCTLAASCAFMLPMSTPPNAIVFASGHIRVVEMAKAGFWLNVVGLVLLGGLAWFWLG